MSSIAFSFFENKNKTTKQERSMWKIVSHPTIKNRLIKFILIDSVRIKLRLHRSINQEIRNNKLLIKNKNKLPFVLVPFRVEKITNASNKTVYYIEMEKMDGDLTMLKGKIDWESIMLQILTGLIYLNRAGIKHGDLAPRNIFFKKNTKKYTFTFQYKKKKYTVPVNEIEIKIGDFGLANYSKFSFVKKKSLDNNLAYLSSSLMFNKDFRMKSKKKIRFPNNLRKQLIGSNKMLKKKSNKETYDFLKGKVKIDKILKEFA